MTGNEKADLVRSVWNSIGRRDLEGFLDLFTADAELHSAWGALEGVGPYRGRTGLETWWNAFLLETVDTYEGEVEQTISLDDMVLALVRVDGAGSSSGFRISRVVGQIFRFEDGRIARLSVHLDPADAFAEAGLVLGQEDLDG